MNGGARGGNREKATMPPAKPMLPASDALKGVLRVAHQREARSWMRPSGWRFGGEPRHQSTSLGEAVRPLKAIRPRGGDE